MIKKLFATSVLIMGIMIGASIAEAEVSNNAFSLNAFSLNGIQVNGVSSKENHLLPLSDLAKEAIVETASK